MSYFAWRKMMTLLAVRQYGWQRALQAIPASARGAAALSTVMHRVDGTLLALSAGRWSIPRLVAGLPVIRLTTRGARSGVVRTVPTIGIQDGATVALVASNWGRVRHPGWLHNLRADPCAEITVGHERRRFRAEEIEDPTEYERLWRKAVSIYNGYDYYRECCAGRRIPIVVLSSVDG
jgi:deazaflavin-dependent oxidoreductase (nitroreductase family)